MLVCDECGDWTEGGYRWIGGTLLRIDAMGVAYG